MRQFPGCTIWGGRIRRETGRPPSTEDTELCLSSQDRALGRKESCKEGASWRVAEDPPLAFSQVLTSTCTPKPGRNHSKGLEVTVSSAHQRAGTVPVPISQLGEAQDSWVQWVEYTVVSPLSRGKQRAFLST